MLDKIETTEQELIDHKSIVNKTFIGSNFHFIDQINGLRPGCLHLLFGPTHAGKTTIIISILRSLFIKNRDINVGLFLSEEAPIDSKLKFNSMFTVAPRSTNIEIMSELDQNTDLLRLKEYISIVQPDVFIYDNLTTSRFYNDMSSKDQFTFINGLKKLCQENNVALLCVAHTGGQSAFNNKLIDENDIRGSKSVTNLAEHLWALQPLEVGNTKRVFLRVLKHRGYNVKEKLFGLQYNPEKQMISLDEATSFEEFKRIFALRNKL